MGFDFTDMWRLLWRRKLVLLAAMVIGAAAAVSISRALPVLYTSEALLEVESQTPLMRDLNPAASVTTPDRVRTEADILSSRALSAEVVRNLGLAGNPAFKMEPRAPTWLDWIKIGLHKLQIAVQSRTGQVSKPDEEAQAIELFQKRLHVDANDRSHIVAVRLTTGSPDLSARAVNVLLDRYISGQVSANVKISSEENKWLTQQLAGLESDLNKAEAKVQNYREAHRLMDIQAGALPAVQLSEEEKNLSFAEQNYADAKAAYETAVASGSQVGGFVGQETLSSLLIQRLHEQEANAAERLANLRARYGDAHQAVRAAEAELFSIRSKIATENAKIVVSLKRSMDLARDRVESLRQMVDASRAKALAVVSSSSALAQLQQEVETKRHVYTAFLTRMEQTQLATAEFATARVVSVAVPADRADGTPLPVAAVLGAIAGLLLAAASCLLMHVGRGKMGSPGDLVSLTGAAAIGSMPLASGGLRLLPGKRSVPVRILDIGDSGVVETLRALRFSVQAEWGALCTCLLVSSSLPGEGKTTLAVSMALTSAADGLRVLLIEADLRRPAIARVMGAQPAHCIQEFLAGDLTLPQAVHVEDRTGLHCLLSGGASPNAHVLLQSAAFTSLIADARVAYDLIIIDSPPVMRVVDPLILAAHTDCVLFAVDWQRVSRQVVAEALRRFPQRIRENVATVLTRVPRSRLEHRGYYAGYKLPARA